MFSKVSKSAGVTVVQLPQPVRGPDDFGTLPDHRFATMVDGFLAAAEDAYSKNIVEQNILFMAIVTVIDLNNGDDLLIPPGPSVPLLRRYYRVLAKLVEFGMIIVAPVGNKREDAQSDELQTFPGVWSASIPMILVGVSNYGIPSTVGHYQLNSLFPGSAVHV